MTTVNYPNEEAFTRITEFKHILPVNSTKTTIVREYPQDFDRNDTEKIFLTTLFSRKRMSGIMLSISA